MERRIQKLCLADTRTETCAASRTHFYGSEIWVNVLKGCYNVFFHEQCDCPNFKSRNLILLTLGGEGTGPRAI